MDFTDKAGSINELLASPGNGQCADCQKRLDLENAWGVLRYGVLVCQDCKLVHIALESQRRQQGLVEDPGILSCAKSQVWTSDDFTRFIQQGNEKTNQALLNAFPVWVYQPTPNDSISLKEQWISQKYRERSAEEEAILKQPPKNGGMPGLVQFTRKSKNRTEPCAAVLHKEKLYLTSERRKETVSILDVETALLTQDNGIMLAYRRQDSPVTDEYLFAHLSHEDQTVVLEWVNTLLYIKYKLLKERNPNTADKDLGKLLNRYVIRQSYVTAGSIPDQLLFFVLSESRLAVFEHHLDEKPRYQTRIYQNHMTSVQYLTKVGDVLNIQVEKVYGYDEWLQALDQALNNERLCSLPERLKAPSPIHKEPDLNTAMKNIRITPTETIQAPRNDDKTQNKNQLPTEPTSNQLIPPKNIDNQIQSQAAINGKPKNDAHCYPAIGPMGEMGKVARGELPAEAIRPPPPKMNGTQDIIVNPSSSTQDNELDAHQMIKRKDDQENINCYPPIGPTGPRGSSMSYPVQQMNQAVPAKTTDSFARYQPAPSGQGPYNPGQHSQFPPYPPPQRPADSWIGSHGTRRGSSITPPLYQGQPEYSNEPNQWNSGRRTLTSQYERSNSEPGVWQQHSKPPRHPGELTPSPPIPEGTWPVNSAPQKPIWGSEDVIKSRSQESSFQRDWSARYDDSVPIVWRDAEPYIDDLIENGFVPASDMQSAHIDPNLMEHARFCAGELYNAVRDNKYEMALSFLRGFREIFAHSRDPDIRRDYTGYGEKETLKNIVVRHYTHQRPSGQVVLGTTQEPARESWDRTSSHSTGWNRAKQRSPVYPYEVSTTLKSGPDSRPSINSQSRSWNGIQNPWMKPDMSSQVVSNHGQTRDAFESHGAFGKSDTNGPFGKPDGIWSNPSCDRSPPLPISSRPYGNASVLSSVSSTFETSRISPDSTRLNHESPDSSTDSWIREPHDLLDQNPVFPRQLSHGLESTRKIWDPPSETTRVRSDGGWPTGLASGLASSLSSGLSTGLTASSDDPFRGSFPSQMQNSTVSSIWSTH